MRGQLLMTQHNPRYKPCKRHADVSDLAAFTELLVWLDLKNIRSHCNWRLLKYKRPDFLHRLVAYIIGG